MSKVLTDEIIPALKGKVESSIANLKVYTVTPTSDGVFNIIDSTLPSAPVDGLHFMLRPETAANNAKISLNGGQIIAGVVQAPAGGRSTAQQNSNFALDAASWYFVVFAGGYWRFVNTFDLIRTNDIANGAVTAAKADVAGIMNSAGSNGQLFGLGGKCIDISNTDLNSLQQKTGFYVGENLTNAPIAKSGQWYYIQQYIMGNGNYVLQRATSLFDAAIIYQRVRDNGTWEAWQRIMTSYYTLNQVYPVGTVYISSTLDTPEKVAAALGGGTWVRTLQGGALVGSNSTDNDFVGIKSGGTKTQDLVALVGAINNDATTIGNRKATIPSSQTTYNYAIRGTTVTGSMTGSDATNVTRSDGGTPSTLQPYSTRYIYQRTA